MAKAKIKRPTVSGATKYLGRFAKGKILRDGHNTGERYSDSDLAPVPPPSREIQRGADSTTGWKQYLSPDRPRGHMRYVPDQTDRKKHAIVT